MVLLATHGLGRNHPGPEVLQNSGLGLEPGRLECDPRELGQQLFLLLL